MGTNPVRANSERTGGTVSAQFMLSFCRDVPAGVAKISSGRLETLLWNMRKGRGTEILCPAPFGDVAQSELFNLGSLLVLEVTHLRQVFGAGCGVQACFVCTLRQLCELAVAALVVNHADEDCCEEEDQ